jgi:hypothetical protein
VTAKIIAKQLRPVMCIDIDTKEVKRFECIMAVSRDGFNPKNIGNVCRGKGLSHKKHVWMYERDYLVATPEEIKAKIQAVHNTKLRFFSEETRSKISRAHLGHLTSERTRQAISSSNTGRKNSDESKQKMSESRHRYIARLKSSTGFASKISKILACIREYRSSDLNQTQFCELNKIKRPTLRFWISKEQEYLKYVS